MFPIVHNLMVKRLCDNPRYSLVGGLKPLQMQLLQVGSITPDLVSSMGMDRNFGHLMGKELYAYTEKAEPEALSFALGVWLHGADPCGLDYYADEHWQGAKGWCFQKAVPFVSQVASACNLPEKWGLWKCHNFVEMAMELEAAKVYPDLAAELLTAVGDGEVQAVVRQILVGFDGATEEKVAATMAKVGEIFALDQLSAASLATKYSAQLLARHGVETKDVQAMTEIILAMQQELKAEFWDWLAVVENLMVANLAAADVVL